MGLINIFKPLSTLLYPAPVINLCNSINFSSENISGMWGIKLGAAGSISGMWGIKLGAAGSKCAMLPPKQYYPLGIFINFWSLDSGSQNTIFGATLSFRATFSLREKCNNFNLWPMSTNSDRDTKSSKRSQQLLSFMRLPSDVTKKKNFRGKQTAKKVF